MRGLALALALMGLGLGLAMLGQPAVKAQGARGDGMKICRATNGAGRSVAWGCNARQHCCFNAATDQGYCSSGGC